VPLSVCFVRHGESQANVDRVFANRVDQPFALTDAGRDQARILADGLRERGVTHVYSSPLPRAQQTAETIGAAHGVPVAITDALREYDCGEFEGLSYDGEHAWRWEAHARIELAWRDGDLDARHPSGESARDIAARFLPFMATLTERHGADDRLTLVGHGGLFLIALPMLFDSVSIDAARRYGLGHCEMVIATWDAGNWTCQEWGERDLNEANP
jgi:broad specificity phosphatase PhoE